MPKFTDEWDRTDLIEVLEVLPDEEEHGTAFVVESDRQGLRLWLDHYEPRADIELSVEGCEQPAFSIEFWFDEAVPSRDRVGEYVAFYGARMELLSEPAFQLCVRVDPHIRVSIGDVRPE